MLGRSVAYNMLGGAAALTIGFVSSLLLARWLGPADRGLLAILFTASQVGVALGGLGLPVAVIYYASRRNSPSGALLGASLVFTCLLAVIFLPAFWLLREPLADAFSRGHGRNLWVAAAALVPLTFFDWTTHNQLLGKLRFGLYNVLVVVSKAATLIAIVVLVGLAGLGVTGGLLATAAASVVMIAGSLPPILAEERPSLDLRLLRALISYGTRVQVGTIIQFLNYRFDVLVLQFFRPLASVGYYIVAEILAELVVGVALAIQTSILPLVTRDEEAEASGRTTVLAVRHHGILALVATVANAAFAPLVVIFGYGSSFRPALVPIFILLPSMWFLGTGTVITADLRGRGRPGTASLLAGAVVVVTIVLDLVLIPPLGVPGAAIASVVSYVLFGIASLVVLSRISGIPVRALVIPTRADFAVYPTALRTVRTLLTGRSPSATENAG